MGFSGHLFFGDKMISNWVSIAKYDIVVVNMEPRTM